MTTNLIIILITLAFVLVDVVTGIIKALKNKDFKSSKMREGLFHKFAFVIIVGVAFLIEYAESVVDLGLSVPLGIPACVYVILTEIGSIIENIAQINPAIVPEKLKELFGNIANKK